MIFSERGVTRNPVSIRNDTIHQIGIIDIDGKAVSKLLVNFDTIRQIRITQKLTYHVVRSAA